MYVNIKQIWEENSNRKQKNRDKSVKINADSLIRQIKCINLKPV